MLASPAVGGHFVRETVGQVYLIIALGHLDYSFNFGEASTCSLTSLQPVIPGGLEKRYTTSCKFSL
jgi:hypothetical protein